MESNKPGPPTGKPSAEKGSRESRSRIRYDRAAAWPLVRAAFFAAADRSAAVRFCALERACLESAADDATLCPNPVSRAFVARERRGLGRFSGCFPRSRSRAACFRTPSAAVPLRGAASLTPARRALDSPIAMACFVERAPCFPSRMCSISSRMNSPACVDGAFPSRLSFRARASVSLSGMVSDMWSPPRDPARGVKERGSRYAP